MDSEISALAIELARSPPLTPPMPSQTSAKPALWPSATILKASWLVSRTSPMSVFPTIFNGMLPSFLLKI